MATGQATDPAVRWLPELGATANPFGPVDLVTFRRSPGGRVASVFFLDCTWVRLDRVTA